MTPDDPLDWLGEPDAPAPPDLSGLADLLAAAPPELFAPPPPPPPAVPPPVAVPFVYGVVVHVPAGGGHAVRVEHQVPPGLKALATTPAVKAVRPGQPLVWEIDDVAGGTKLNLRVQAVATGPAACTPRDLTTFDIRFARQVRTQVAVAKPHVAAALAGPASARVGTVAEFALRVTSDGNWPAANVTATLAADGLDLLDADPIAVGTLPAGEAFTATVRATCTRPGPVSLRASVTADDVPAVAAGHSLTVTAPAVAVRLDPPAEWLVNRDHALAVAVSNPGTADAQFVSARLVVPYGWTAAADEAQFDPTTRTLFWTIDALAAGATQTLRVTVRPTVPEAGDLSAAAEALDVPAATADLTAHAAIDPADRDDVLGELARSLRDAAAGVAAAAAAPDRHAAREHPHIVFAVAATEYAVPLAAVQEVGRPPAVTRVPFTPDWLAGVGNVRGDVVSVADLRAFLGEPPDPAGRDRRLVVARSSAGDVVAGLLVDAVRGLRSIPPAAVAAPAGPVAARAAAYMAGVAEVGGRAVVVLDPDRLLRSPDFRPNTPPA